MRSQIAREASYLKNEFVKKSQTNGSHIRSVVSTIWMYPLYPPILQKIKQYKERYVKKVTLGVITSDKYPT